MHSERVGKQVQQAAATPTHVFVVAVRVVQVLRHGLRVQASALLRRPCGLQVLIQALRHVWRRLQQ